MKKVRIIAILAAIVTAVLVYVFLANINKPNEIELTSVVTAKYNIEKDVIISNDMLTVVELPSEAVHSSAAQNINEVVGKVAIGSIVQDEQVIKAKLVEPGESNESSLAYTIEEGQRAFTVAVDEVSGVAGLLQPQDFVDVLIILTVERTLEIPSGETMGDVSYGGIVDTSPGETGETIPEDTVETLVVWETYSAELLQNIKILAVGKQLGILGPEEEENNYSTATLSVTPEQAIKLNLAIASGEVRLILRSPLNSEIIELDIMTVDDLVEDLEESDFDDSEK